LVLELVALVNASFSQNREEAVCHCAKTSIGLLIASILKCNRNPHPILDRGEFEAFVSCVERLPNAKASESRGRLSGVEGRSVKI
jgi:hypothetical protein